MLLLVKNIEKKQKDISFWLTFIFSIFSLIFLFIVILDVVEPTLFYDTLNMIAINRSFLAFTILTLFALSWYYSTKKEPEVFDIYRYMFWNFIIFSFATLIFAIFWLTLFLVNKYAFESGSPLYQFETFSKKLFIGSIITDSIYILMNILVKSWNDKPVIDWKKINIERDNHRKRKNYLKEKNRIEEDKKSENISNAKTNENNIKDIKENKQDKM